MLRAARELGRLVLWSLPVLLLACLVVLSAASTTESFKGLMVDALLPHSPEWLVGWLKWAHDQAASNWFPAFGWFLAACLFGTGLTKWDAFMDYAGESVFELTAIVRPLARKYPKTFGAVRRARDRARLVKCLHYIRGVRDGHLDLYDRFCASRLVNAALVLFPEMCPSETPLDDLREEQRREISDEIAGLRDRLIDRIVYGLRKTSVSKVVYFDNLANRMLAHAVAKRLDPDGSKNVQLQKIKRSENGVLSFQLEEDGHGNLVKPIIDDDGVLVLVANLGPAGGLEELLAVVRRQAQPTVEIHVAVVFDGSGRPPRMIVGVPRRRIQRLVRVDLGLNPIEKCASCRTGNECNGPELAFLLDNYIPS